MRQNASAVVEWGKLEAVLAVFQKLLSSKANETYAFQLMGTIVMNVSDFVFYKKNEMYLGVRIVS